MNFQAFDMHEFQSLEIFLDQCSKERSNLIMLPLAPIESLVKDQEPFLLKDNHAVDVYLQTLLTQSS